MKSGLLQASIEDRRLVLDPRTKLFMLITMAIFVLGGTASDIMPFAAPVLCAMPVCYLFIDRQYYALTTYVILYGGLYFINGLIVPGLTGSAHYILYILTVFIIRFLPGIMMARYVFSSTTVSEFMAAMERMRVSNKITIPMSVMFRFIPTVLEEFSSINTAMKMRDIRIGGKNASKIVEYRFVPLMACCVKIGNELSAAALARGLGGGIKRTNICKIGFHGWDSFMFIICTIPYVGLILSAIGILE